MSQIVPEIIRRADADDRLSLHQGSVIAGKYQVDRVLGVGGMGTVVAARSLETGETVAIKFMLPHCAQQRQLMVRFQREARATERIKSEHVRRVIASGSAGVDAPFIVMEYLDGEDLKSFVRREGPLEPRQAAAYVSQVCNALAEAHALGIVHRDLKPANLFLARRPAAPSIIKVLDFGVAKFDSPNVAGDEMDVTEGEGVVGSRHYMAPEQMTDPAGVNALADVWALGAILHYLLSGKTPFAANTAEEVIVNVLREPPHALEDLRPCVPARLASISRRCLAKDRKLRYQNVTELARALAPFLRSEDGDEPPRSVPVPSELSRTLPMAFLGPYAKAAAARNDTGPSPESEEITTTSPPPSPSERAVRSERTPRRSERPLRRSVRPPPPPETPPPQGRVGALSSITALLAGGLLALIALRGPWFQPSAPAASQDIIVPDPPAVADTVSPVVTQLVIEETAPSASAPSPSPAPPPAQPTAQPRRPPRSVAPPAAMSAAPRKPPAVAPTADPIIEQAPTPPAKRRMFGSED